MRLMIAEMPGPHHDVKVMTAFDDITKLSVSDRYRFFSPPIQAKVDVVQQHMARAVETRAVDRSVALEDDLLKHVVHKYPYFIRIPGAPASSDGPVTAAKFGFDAMKIMMSSLVPKIEANTARPAEVADFVIWDCLVPEPEKSRWRRHIADVKAYSFKSTGSRRRMVGKSQAAQDKKEKDHDAGHEAKKMFTGR